MVAQTRSDFTRDTARRLARLAESGREVLAAYRDIAHHPSRSKQPMVWQISQAAKMVGRSKNSLIAAEDVVGRPEPITTGSVDRRGYQMEDIIRLMEHFGTRPSFNVCRYISVISYKGGVGKSFTNIHLAHYFASKGYRVLVLDCDPQATCSQNILGVLPDEEIDSEMTLAPIFRDDAGFLEMNNLLDTNWSNLKIVPANLGLLDADLVARNKGLGVDLLFKAIEPIEHEFDVVLFDSPPTLSYLSLCPLYASDMSLIPITPRMADLSSTIAFLDMLAEVAEQGIEVPLIRMVFNQVSREKQAKLQPDEIDSDEREVIQIFRERYRDWLLEPEMLSSATVQRLASEYRSLFETSIHDKTWRRAMKGPMAVGEEVERLLKVYDAEEMSNG